MADSTSMDRAFVVALALTFWGGATMGLASGGRWGALDVGALAVLGGCAVGCRRLAWRPASCLLLAALLGGVLAGRRDARWVEAVPGVPSSPLIGEVQAVRLVGARVDVVVTPDAHPAHALALRLDRRPAGVAAGARVRVVGRFWRPDPADEPGGYDARAAARAAQIGWQGTGTIELIEPAARGGTLALREGARARLGALSRPYGAAVLTGLLLGDRAAVPDSARAALQVTGTGHLLAVSGLHVGGLAALVAALVMAGARRMHRLRPARWGALVAVPVALVFVALAQFPLSACRAGLMVGAYLGGRALGRRADPVVLLGWAAVGIVAVTPTAASSAGFQLSFGAVAALLASGGERGLRGAVTTAVVAAGATAPLEAWHFGTVAPLAPLANLLLCPIAALVLVPLGLAGLAVAPLWTGPLEWAAAGAEAMVALAEAIGALGGGVVVGRHAAPVVALPLVVLFAARHRRWVRGAIVAAALGLVALWGWPRGPRVDFLPVGQGDAVLIRGGGRAVLLDAGPEDRGFRLIGALRRAGVGRLDLAIVTHAHPDHFAGLAAAARVVEVGEVWFNGRDPPSPRWRRLRAALADVEWRRPRAGERVVLGAATLTAWSGDDTGLAENDASLIVRLDAPGGSLLSTGDIEAPGEARLLALGPLAVEPVTVLKVPHHGSRTSSGAALLDAVCPRAAVFTVGRRNRHRLPHPAIVERYRRRGVDVWRTDIDGRVTLRLGVSPTIEAHRRPRRPLGPPSCRVPLLTSTRRGR